MILLSEWHLSSWAYYECLRGNDIPAIRKVITHPCWAYAYCYYIEDREDMWRKIKDSHWIRQYYKHVRGRSDYIDIIK